VRPELRGLLGLPINENESENAVFGGGCRWGDTNEFLETLGHGEVFLLQTESVDE
jgi:hypothetical protein